MAEPARVALPALDAWLVESLRLTCFPAPDSVIEPSGWWAGVTGGEPESTTLKVKGAVQVHEGHLEQGRMRLTVQPPRIDWELIFPAPEEPETFTLPTIGPYPDVAGVLSKLAAKWFALASCPRPARLAFAGTLLQPVEDREHGYELAAKYLRDRVYIDAKGSRDLIYRINRPRLSTSGITGLEINRLNTWAVMVVSKIATVSGDKARRTFPMGQAFALRLELDVNTSAEFDGQFTQEQTPQVFQELLALGQEIAAAGDIA